MFITKIATLFLVTFMPFVELRLGIPLGILKGTMNLPFGLSLTGMGMHPLAVFLICIAANFLLAVFLYELILRIDRNLHAKREGSWLRKRYVKFMDRTHRRVKRFTDKYGAVGVALFIAVPLPGSGVWTGALGAFMLGLRKDLFLTASAVGVTLAGIIVTLLTLTGAHIF